MDRVHNRVFIGCRGDRPLLTVVDGNSGKIVATKPVGPGVDALEFDPKAGLIFVSTGGDGTLSIFHEDSPDKYSLMQIAGTLPGARTLALDHKTGKVYLPVADIGPVDIACVPVGGALSPQKVAELVAQLDPRIVVAMPLDEDAPDTKEALAKFFHEMGGEQPTIQPKLSVTISGLPLETTTVLLESRGKIA